LVVINSKNTTHIKEFGGTKIELEQEKGGSKRVVLLIPKNSRCLN
jgi:hypothetical protein